MIGAFDPESDIAAWGAEVERLLEAIDYRLYRLESDVEELKKIVAVNFEITKRLNEKVNYANS